MFHWHHKLLELELWRICLPLQLPLFLFYSPSWKLNKAMFWCWRIVLFCDKSCFSTCDKPNKEIFRIPKSIGKNHLNCICFQIIFYCLCFIAITNLNSSNIRRMYSASKFIFDFTIIFFILNKFYMWCYFKERFSDCMEDFFHYYEVRQQTDWG